MTQPAWLLDEPLVSASMRISSTAGSSTGTGEAMVKNASIARVVVVLSEERWMGSCQARRLGLGSGGAREVEGRRCSLSSL